MNACWREYEKVKIVGGLFDCWVNFDDKYSEESALDLHCMRIPKGARKPVAGRAVGLILQPTDRRGFFRRCGVFFWFFVVSHDPLEESLSSVFLEPMPLDEASIIKVL